MDTQHPPLTEEQLAERRQTISGNLELIKKRVEGAAAQRTGAGQPVRLVAVSKTKPASDVLIAYGTGHRRFGENVGSKEKELEFCPLVRAETNAFMILIGTKTTLAQVQELVDKAAQLPMDIEWHFIGSLQSNKCKALASIPNLTVVETIDSARKADTMNKACANSGRITPLSIFVQINTSGEESKSGIPPAECVSVAKHILENCPHLRLAGLMTIGSPEHSEMEPNPDFECLVDCRKQIKSSCGIQQLELSMGMSDDFEAAIKAGSTNVRVGSSIFGARIYHKQ
ncbi:hypothetical protein HK102_005351 [Quaeritorhiza haematococci]|nr:hypothetical protein HK102_005351 [Quaeritorhiza haematococci]